MRLSVPTSKAGDQFEYSRCIFHCALVTHYRAANASVMMGLPFRCLNKYGHVLDNLIRHARQCLIWQVLAMALSPRGIRVPEHVCLLQELVRQSWRVRRLSVRHASRCRGDEVVSGLCCLVGYASGGVGGTLGGLQRLQRLVCWVFRHLTRDSLVRVIFDVRWRACHSREFSVSELMSLFWYIRSIKLHCRW